MAKIAPPPSPLPRGLPRSSRPGETAPPTGPSRGERARAHEADSGAREHGGEEHAPSVDASLGLLGAAFSALRRVRQKRAHKTRKKKTGATHGPDAYHSLEEEDEEDIVQRPALRTWLGADASGDGLFEEARREVRLLERMEQQGEPPSRILGEFTRQLGEDHGSRFKRLLSHEVRPLLDSLAERVGQVSTEERRKLAAYVSRALHQAGAENASTFDALLDSTVIAEAEHLRRSRGSPTARAEEFSLALRRASSPAWRGALVGQCRVHLERLAQESVGESVAERGELLGHLLRAGEALPVSAATSMAEAVVTGLRVARRPGAVADLVEILGPALRASPGGGVWGVQLLDVLSARDERAAAQRLAAQLQSVLSEARARCTPVLLALRELQGQARDPVRERSLRQRLDEAATLLTRLLPTCGALFSQDRHLSPELVLEALAALGTLDQVAGTPSGQQALRLALWAQERGEWTFLGALPVVAPALSQPPCLRLLEQGGLSSVSFKLGAPLFLKRVATELAHALGGCVVSWTQKGDASAARALLRTALVLNASLYGLGPEGLEQAVHLLEELRAHPTASRARRCGTRLETLARQHPTANRSGSIQALRPLVTALARRDPLAMAVHLRTRVNTEAGPRLTGLEIAAVQTTLAKERTEKREPPSEVSTGKGAGEARGKGSRK